jgi:hypothetical protein
MQMLHSSQSQVAFHSDVPPEAHQAVIEHLISAEQADVRRAGKATSKIRLIEQKYMEQVRALMTASKYEKLRAYVAEEKRAQAERLLPPRGPEMSQEELADLRAQRRESSLTFLTKLGVSANDLAKLTKSTRRQLWRLVPPPPTLKGKPVQLVLPADVPPAIRAKKSNPWTRVTPPYPGWAWNYTGEVAGFGFTPTLYLDSAAGLVGNSNDLTDSNASNFDHGFVTYNTNVGFWYRMPSTGLVEVWIEGQSAASHHHLTLHNEFGWSDSSVAQVNLLTLRTSDGVPDERKTSQMSSFSEIGDTSGFWDNHYLSDGATYWAHLFSAVSYPSGSWIYIQVGTQTFNYCTANDVAVYSTVHFRWFIKSVWVESTGG